MQRPRLRRIFASRPRLTYSPQRGGAALEYVLVSTFAALLTIAALGFVGKLVKDRLDQIGARLGDGVSFEWNAPFGDRP